MHFPSLWSLHTQLPLAWTLISGHDWYWSQGRGSERNVKVYRAVPPLPLESNAGSASRGVNKCFYTSSDFCSVFSHWKKNKTKHAHKKGPRDETSTLIFIRHISKVVCHDIPTCLPPAAEAQHVSLIFCVWLFHISPHREQRRFSYHVTEAERCSRTFPDWIISALLQPPKTALWKQECLCLCRQSTYSVCVYCQQSRIRGSLNCSKGQTASKLW